MTGHPESMAAAATADRIDARASAGPAVREPEAAENLRLEEVYERSFDFVWRSARRMGVAEAALDDVVQEVFLVAHRRLADFEGRSRVQTWLFGILLRVVSDHRRTLRRKGGLAPLPDVLPDESTTRCPAERAETAEKVRLLHALLDTLDDDKRAVFVLSELEQMTAPEIAEALGVNLNTVYSRLRVARKKFDEALARHRALAGNRAGRTP